MNEEFTDKILIILKISIITFISIILLGSFIPYYDTSDGYSFGLSAIAFSQGIFTITNELLKDTGEWEFVPSSWLKTIDNEAINAQMVGILVIGSIFLLNWRNLWTILSRSNFYHTSFNLFRTNSDKSIWKICWIACSNIFSYK